MILKMECPYCQQPVEFPDDAVGQWVDCPGCGKKMPLQTKPKPAPGFSPAAKPAAPVIPKVAAPQRRIEFVVEDFGDQLHGAGILLAALCGVVALFLAIAALKEDCSWWLVVSVVLTGLGLLVQAFIGRLICRSVGEGLRLLRQIAEVKK